jgi:hypothetical protein
MIRQDMTSTISGSPLWLLLASAMLFAAQNSLAQFNGLDEATRIAILKDLRQKVSSVNSNNPGIEVVGIPAPNVYNVTEYIDIMACKRNPDICTEGLELEAVTAVNPIEALVPTFTSRTHVIKKTVTNSASSKDITAEISIEKALKTSVKLTVPHTAGMEAATLETKFSIASNHTDGMRTEFTVDYQFSNSCTWTSVDRTDTPSTVTFTVPPRAKATAMCTYEEATFEGNFSYYMFTLGRIIITELKQDESSYRFVMMDSRQARLNYWLPQGYINV